MDKEEIQRYHDVIMDAICSIDSDSTEIQKRLTMINLISTASYLLGVIEGMTGNGRNTWKN
jgi:hypothetical protein